MAVVDLVEVLILGALAGTVAGMFGVGGGVLFVPLLTLVLGLGQVEAEGTSLLAMLPVALVGGYAQYRRGFIHIRPMLVVGVAAACGAVAGSLAANSVPEDLLRRGFGVYLVIIATQLARRAHSERRARLAAVGSSDGNGNGGPDDE